MSRLRILAGVALLGFGIGSTSSEAARLRKHFVTVERELLARDVSALSSEQRAARTELVQLLRRYAAAGSFPRNQSLPGMVPFFRDASGNLCAMAFLISATGRADIVDHVARTRNNAYVPELADEAGLAEWLDRHGLTLAEAARIQPTYGGHAEADVPAGAVVAAGAATTVSLASMVWNARSMNRLAGHRSRTIVGLTAAAVNLSLAVAYIGEENGRTTFGILNLAVAAPAAILGMRALGAPAKAAASKSPRLTLTPIATAERRMRLGFQGNFRF